NIRERSPEIRCPDPASTDPGSMAALIIEIADQITKRRPKSNVPPRLVLMIDEIDELLPGAAVSSLDQRSFLRFLATLRAYREERATETPAVPLVIVGTTIREAAYASAMWSDPDAGLAIQNPLFEQVVAIPLSPFAPSDLEEMARKHGSEMQLDFARHAL